MYDMKDIDKVVVKLNTLAVHNVAPNIMHETIQTIRELQSQIPKWNYVENGDLPEENSEIYVSFKNSAGIHTDIATFHNNEFFYFSETELYGYIEEKYTEVIAWMELPKFEEE